MHRELGLVDEAVTIPAGLFSLEKFRDWAHSRAVRVPSRGALRDASSRSQFRRKREVALAAVAAIAGLTLWILWRDEAPPMMPTSAITGGARALLAIRAHEAETGALPESLQALVPAWIESVPLDPCDEKELRYSAPKRIIYSIGSDGKECGGSAKEKGWDAFADREEPTLRLDPAAWEYMEE